MGQKLELREHAFQLLVVVGILCAGYLTAEVIDMAQVAILSLQWLPVNVLTPLITDLSLVLAVVVGVQFLE